jgi:hypothetical protein
MPSASTPIKSGNSELFHRGTCRQIAEDWKSCLLRLRCFDQKIDPADEQQELQAAKKRMLDAPTGGPDDQNRDSGGYDQPCHKQVEGLKRVEPYPDIATKTAASEEYDRRNHAENGDVAQHRCGSVTHSVENVDKFRTGAWLRRAAVRTVRGLCIHARSTICTKRQPLSPDAVQTSACEIFLTRDYVKM